MDLKLDASGDLELVDGEFSLTSGAEAIAQELRQRLLFFLGEWFLDVRLGVDYFGTILVKNPNMSRVNQLYRAVIIGTDGIKSIRSLDFDFDSATRALSMEIDAELEDLTTYTFRFPELYLFSFQGAA